MCVCMAENMNKDMSEIKEQTYLKSLIYLIGHVFLNTHQSNQAFCKDYKNRLTGK